MDGRLKGSASFFAHLLSSTARRCPAAGWQGAGKQGVVTWELMAYFR